MWYCGGLNLCVFFSNLLLDNWKEHELLIMKWYGMDIFVSTYWFNIIMELCNHYPSKIFKRDVSKRLKSGFLRVYKNTYGACRSVSCLGSAFVLKMSTLLSLQMVVNIQISYMPTYCKNFSWPRLYFHVAYWLIHVSRCPSGNKKMTPRQWIGHHSLQTVMSLKLGCWDSYMKTRILTSWHLDFTN